MVAETSNTPGLPIREDEVCIPSISRDPNPGTGRHQPEHSDFNGNTVVLKAPRHGLFCRNQYQKWSHHGQPGNKEHQFQDPLFGDIIPK